MTRALMLCLLLTACTTPAGTHYRVEADVYVTDSKLLCRHAWDVALAEFGPSVAEMVTMRGGEFDPAKCVAVLYQVGSPDGVVSAGIYVRGEK